MRYRINQLADISQGSILTRIKSQDNNGICSEALTMQELSYYCNESDDLATVNEVVVDKYRYENCLFSQAGDVLVGLSSGNAMVIEKERAGKLVLSNFAVIRIKDKKKLDPYYLCWMINENNDVKRQLLPLYQKTSRVVVIPISTFKDIEIECCHIDKQVKIGKTYDLSRKLVRTKRLKVDKANKIINYGLKEVIG